MRERIEILIKTAETLMENIALMTDNLKKLQDQVDTMEIVPHGTWEEINENTSLKRCSTCGRTQEPTLYCKGCGSKNRNG